MTSARLKATQILLKLFTPGSRGQAAGRRQLQLQKELSSLTPADRSLVQELCYGVTRWFWQLDYIAQKLLKKPLKTKDFDIYLVMLLGIYQLLYLRVPTHAAINESVETARKLKKEWATKLVNAVLRAFIKNEEKLIQIPNTDLQAFYSHPLWLINKIKSAWPSWQQILTANNQRPLLCLRVNQQQKTRDEYLTILKEQGMNATAISATQKGIILETPLDIKLLPFFSEGMVSVQDGSAQLAAELLNPQPNERILDACAAPGGKTAHILERTPNLKELVALDNDPNRMERVRENLDRIKGQATLITHDVTDTGWWNEQLFDRILLDAPCSATGVINRHPDIKILRTTDDISRLKEVQYEALTTLWPMLKPQGHLLYVTCSILPEENEEIIAEFVKKKSDCYVVKLEKDWGIPTEHGRQILPGMHLGMDGFYFALLQKK